MSYDSEFDIDLQNKADEVKEATGNNQHTEAYRLICEFLGLKDTASKLEAIQEVQQREGYLPFSEYEKRQHIYNYMNMQGIDILGKEAYDKYFYQNT